MDTGWTWTDADELSQGIYLAGYNNFESKLYLMSFDTSDAASGLTIGIPREVWRAHGDERILFVGNYAGSAMLIGTNKGIRNVIIVDREGNVAVGPLIETGAEVKSIDFWDGYAFFGGSKVVPGTYTTKVKFKGIFKLDLGSFAMAMVTGVDADFYDVLPSIISVCVPPWHRPGDPPYFSVPGSAYGLQPGNQTNAAEEYALDIGSIRFGSSVDKEIRRLEMTVDLFNIGYPAHASVANNPILSNPPVLNTTQFMDFIIRGVATDWVGASGGTCIVGQMNSTSDYRWMIMVDNNGYLILKYKDSTDTIRTLTSTSPLPAERAYSAYAGLWIYVSFWSNQYCNFHYRWVDSSDADIPSLREWIFLGQADLGATHAVKSLPTYPIKIVPETWATDIRMQGFDLWDTNSYFASSSVHQISWRPYGDLLGRVWTMPLVPTSPTWFVKYRVNGSEWTNLSLAVGAEPATYVGTERTWSVNFPTDLIARELDLAIVTTPGVLGSPILSWRLLSEPVPAPRFYRHYIPVQCYDNVTTPNGGHLMNQGRGKSMHDALDVLYRAGSVMEFQPPYWKTSADTLNVRIEGFEFKQFTPMKGGAGWGGIGLLVLKEIE